ADIGIERRAVDAQQCASLRRAHPASLCCHIDISINIDTSIHRRYGRWMANSGLEGVVAATTRLSDVDGERGQLVIAGYPVGELAERVTFEETTWLLWHGDLPRPGELEGFRSLLAAQRRLPLATLRLLRECAQA